MKRRFIPLLLAALLSLTGCAAGANGETTAETQETMIVYKALPLPDLTVNIPEGYEETSSRFYDKFYIKDDATIIITEDNEKGDMPPRDFSVDALTQYQKLTNSLEMIGDSTTLAGDQIVQILEFTYTIEAGDQPISTMVGYSTDGRTMYIITCKCDAENYTAHREEFLTVIQSQRPDKEWIGAAERSGQTEEETMFD